MVRFFAHTRYPYLKPYSTEYEEVAIPFLALDYHKADRTEYHMCVSFIRNGGRCIISRHYAGVFTHQNMPDEPSTIHRPGRQFSNDFFIRTARYWYRQLRYNFDLLTASRFHPK